MRPLPPPWIEVLDYLDDLGYRDLYLGGRAGGGSPPAAAVAASTLSPSAPPDPPSQEVLERLATLRTEAEACRDCKLCERRKKVVFGSGPAGAELMLIGEGPGAQEDLQGLPFVGPAGELLTKILGAIEISRDDVYITNTVKCRPPGNRDPEPDEVAACRRYLEQQIELVAPKVIVALGRVAAQLLLETDESLGRLRGRWHEVRGVPTRATYHPAALLRNAQWKRPTWEDMKLVRERLRGA